MDDFDTAYANARDERAFSNGTDWEIWQYNNCETCAHDRETREPNPPLGAGGLAQRPDVELQDARDAALGGVNLGAKYQGATQGVFRRGRGYPCRREYAG